MRTQQQGRRPAGGRRNGPLVAGVAGGVGTTMVATAIGGGDLGVFVGRGADVLVCRATGDSLVRAGRAAQLVIGSTGRPPVIAVTAADFSGPSRPVAARLRLLEPHAAAIVVLPFVRRWRDLAVPLDEVRGLLAVPHSEVPRVLRRYADAARQIRAQLGVPISTPVAPSRPARAATTPLHERTR